MPGPCRPIELSMPLGRLGHPRRRPGPDRGASMIDLVTTAPSAATSKNWSQLAAGGGAAGRGEDRVGQRQPRRARRVRSTRLAARRRSDGELTGAHRGSCAQCPPATGAPTRVGAARCPRRPSAPGRRGRPAPRRRSAPSGSRRRRRRPAARRSCRPRCRRPSTPRRRTAPGCRAPAATAADRAQHRHRAAGVDDVGAGPRHHARAARR